MTNKKQAMGKDLFASPNLFYKKELLEIEGNSIWVREGSTKAMAEFFEASARYNEKLNANGTPKEGFTKEDLDAESYRVSESLFRECLCDEQGNLIYAPEDKLDIAAIPDSVTLKIIEKIMELSGRTKKPEVAANLKNADTALKP